VNILTEVNTILDNINIPVETGVFSKKPPEEYVVLTPLADSFAVFGDNKPQVDVQEVRLSLFCKGNYIKRKNQLVKLFLQADFVITDRRYISHEDDTGYFHYSVDLIKNYEMEDI